MNKRPITRRKALKLAGLASAGAFLPAGTDRIASALTEAPAIQGLAASPRGLAAFDPLQGVLLDGSTAAEDSFAIAFGPDGYFIDLGPPGVGCPEVKHFSPGGSYQLFDGPGVFQLTPEIGDARLAPVPELPSEVPPLIALLQDDCELAAHFSAVESYVDAASAQASVLLTQVGACVARIRLAYCELVTLILESDQHHCNFFAVDSHTPCFSQILGGLPGGGCTTGVIALASVPIVLDALAAQLLCCEKAEARLAALAMDVRSDLADRGAVCNSRLPKADSILAQAEGVLAQATGLLANMDGLQAHLTVESLSASCEECSPFDIDPVLLQPSGAVAFRHDGRSIGRYAGVMTSTANTTEDPVLAERMRDLGRRLAQLDRGRVLEVLFPTESAVAHDNIALRADPPPDDSSPVAVVLSALASDARRPPMNFVDTALLFQAYRLFNAAALGERVETSSR